MPPHGGAFTGALHSHSEEYPDDNWNLYSMLDPLTTTALNASVPTHAIGIFKPHSRRCDESPELVSDADEELSGIARFTSPVHIRKIIVIGGSGGDARNPSKLKCYVNRDNIDFTNVGEIRPVQEFTLPINSDGSIECTTAIHPFTNVSTCAFYFCANHGADTTSIRYIGMQGEHAHYRREAVDTIYEVLCTGSETAEELKMAEELGVKGSHHH